MNGIERFDSDEFQSILIDLFYLRCTIRRGTAASSNNLSSIVAWQLRDPVLLLLCFFNYWSLLPHNCSIVGEWISHSVIQLTGSIHLLDRTNLGYHLF